MHQLAALYAAWQLQHAEGPCGRLCCAVVQACTLLPAAANPVRFACRMHYSMPKDAFVVVPKFLNRLLALKLLEQKVCHAQACQLLRARSPAAPPAP